MGKALALQNSQVGQKQIFYDSQASDQKHRMLMALALQNSQVGHQNKYFTTPK